MHVFFHLICRFYHFPGVKLQRSDLHLHLKKIGIFSESPKARSGQTFYSMKLTCVSPEKIRDRCQFP